MIKNLCFLFLLCCQITIHAQNKVEQEPFLTKSLSNEAIKNVEVNTQGGSISVAGVPSDKARVEVYIYPSNRRNNETISKEEIQKRLDENYELKIAVSNNKLTATAKAKHKDMDWKRSLSISFKVYVPNNVSSELATSGGSINLKDLNGTHDFSTSGGSLHINNLSGITKGRTSGGSIHVSNSKDFIELTTSGGSITAEKCMGTMNMTTSGGSLKLNQLQGVIKSSTSGGSITGSAIEGELMTHTSGGSIKLTNLSCSLEASTSAGQIEVTMRELGKYIRLNNSTGNINLQLPANKGLEIRASARNIRTAALTNFNGKMEDDEIDGKLNGGGIPVTVRASNGRLNLVWK